MSIPDTPSNHPDRPHLHYAADFTWILLALRRSAPDDTDSNAMCADVTAEHLTQVACDTLTSTTVAFNSSTRAYLRWADYPGLRASRYAVGPRQGIGLGCVHRRTDRAVAHGSSAKPEGYALETIIAEKGSDHH